MLVADTLLGSMMTYMNAAKERAQSSNFLSYTGRGARQLYRKMLAVQFGVSRGIEPSIG